MKQLIVILTAISVLSCTDRDVKLDGDLRKEADSMFADKVEVIGQEMDSICQSIKDSLIKVKYDSIIKVRKKRIRELSQ